jgi:hypothetical protein
MFLTHIWLIPLLPALGATIIVFFGRKLQKATVSAVCVGSIVLAFVMACGAVRQYSAWSSTPEHFHQPYQTILYTWLGTDTGHMNYTTHDGSPAAFQADAGFLLDPLSSIWLLFVTGVGMLIHIYSTGYMAHEGGYYRFFGYLNLFMFSMLTLILANNYVLLFVGWEGVGLCSYLLIGFYFHRKSASDAAAKAFIVNRIGDAGFLLGMFFVAWYFGSLRFTDVTTAARSGHFTFVCWSLRQIGAASALRLAARRHGRPHAGFRVDSCSNHGDGGRVYGCAFQRAVRTRPDVDEDGCDRRRSNRNLRRLHRPRPKRHQARARLLYSLATWIHVSRARRGSIRRRRLPRLHACILQSSALPRRWFGDPRDERRAGHAQHG